MLGRFLKACLMLTVAMLLGTAPGHSTQVRPAPRTVWDGVYVHPQADRGELHFLRDCVRCHSGGGTGPMPSSEKFFDDWKDERLSSLFIYMKATMPPADPGSLTDWEYLDTLIYFLQLNGYPEGDTDLLPTQMDRIVLIGNESAKPFPAGTSVYALGCLTKTDQGWSIASSSAPSRSRPLLENETSLEILGTQPLGSGTIPLDGTFDVTRNAGARVYTRGSLSYKGNEPRITVAMIRALDPKCQVSEDDSPGAFGPVYKKKPK